MRACVCGCVAQTLCVRVRVVEHLRFYNAIKELTRASQQNGRNGRMVRGKGGSTV